MGVASLVLGIISIVMTVFTAGIFGFYGAIVGIVGIIFGVLGKKNTDKPGVAKAGFICSIVGTVLGLLLYVACVACASAIAGAM